jgi:hypothetical protein
MVKWFSSLIGKLVLLMVFLLTMIVGAILLEAGLFWIGGVLAIFGGLASVTTALMIVDEL